MPLSNSDRRIIRIEEELAINSSRGYRSKARDPIAAFPTNLAVFSAILYPTLVDVGRALVVRTQTLVCVKRLNSRGGSGFTTRMPNFARALSEGCAKKLVDPRAMTPRPDRAPWRVPRALAIARESRQVYVATVQASMPPPSQSEQEHNRSDCGVDYEA